MNLWRLYNVSIAYGKRPSEIFPTETALSDYQLDEACLMVGRSMERELNGQEDGISSAELPSKNKRYKSLRGSVTKTVRIKKDGTW